MISTGGAPARLYGLAKLPERETPFRAVLSFAGNCYAALNSKLASYFKGVSESNIHISSAEKKKLNEVQQGENNGCHPG